MYLETVENTILTSPQAFPCVQEPMKAGGSLGLLKGLLHSRGFWHTRGGWWQTTPASGLLQESSPMVVSAAGGPGLSPGTGLRSPILSQIGLNSVCQLCANERSSDLNESQLLVKCL